MERRRAHLLWNWDLESHAYLLTHRANASYLAVTTTATTIIAGDVAGAVWFLDLPSSNSRERSRRGSHGPDNRRSSSPDNESASPRPLRKKHTILFLAANPIETAQLALDREARAIQKELESAGFRNRFELVTRWAVEPLDLLRELRRLRPTVVHFSGHGGQRVPGEQRPGMNQTACPRSSGVDMSGRNPDTQSSTSLHRGRSQCPRQTPAGGSPATR